MHMERSIEIDAPFERVWPVMVDVERWHEWTASITSIERLDGGPFGVGSRALVRQPLLRPATFVVTELQAGRSFTWATSNHGIHAVAGHVLTPANGGTRATLTLDFSGWPLAILWWWIRWITNRYFRMELNGLKARAEAGPR